MKKELQAEEIDSLQSELATLDEARLPEVLAGRLEAVAKVNKKYEVAQKKKNEAQKGIDAAISKAEELIERADKLGELKPETHKFFKHEYSTKGDRLTSVEKCLEELSSYSSEAALYQKQLAEVQNSALKSQTAIMDVQKCQMEYLECTSEALKFLYGLSAYGIASTQSIVTNLELVLSGAKKKELGEMAKQQMFLVIDQLKSQENLQIRMDKNEDLLDSLKEELRLQQEKEDGYDERFRRGEEKDEEQDEQLRKQIEKDEQHDAAISDGIEKDKEQDTAIQAHEDRLREGDEKDKEQDQALSLMAETDRKQDERLEEQRKKDEEHDSLISDINQQIQDLLKANEELKADIEKRADARMVYISLGISVIALIAAVVSFFI